MGNYQKEKQLVLQYFDALEQAQPSQVGRVMEQFMSEDYSWKSVYPFRDLSGKQDISEKFWGKLKASLRHLQRRMDIFIAGTNQFCSGEHWVMSMGHFMGLFDRDFLGIRHTRKMTSLRYAEFSCVRSGKITKTGIFLDLIGMMTQAGMYPLPPSTGQYFIYPGPRMHNGILLEDAPIAEGEKTLKLVEAMCADLDRYNNGMDPPPADALAQFWHNDMIWYGPAGIGATYTIPRYIEQHTGPFRRGLCDKVFNGHTVRFAEGNFACFFGWPNLSNRNAGGFLGLGRGDTLSDMQVVDVYCRRGNKLSENWVLIDLPWWLKQQGLDIFERTSTILNPKEMRANDE